MLDTKLRAKMDDVMADLAEGVLKDGTDGVTEELRSEIEKAMKVSGLQMTKNNLQSFSEGMSFAVHALGDVKNKDELQKMKEVVMIGIGVVKLFARQAKK